MGRQLAIAAYQLHGRKLDHAPMRLLAFMALFARDDDPAPTFYAGRDELARGLGHVDASSAAARRSVDRVLATLTAAGLITALERARTGRRQSYRLNLSPALWTVSREDHGERGAEDHGERGAEDHGDRGPQTTVSVVHQDHGERGPYTQRTNPLDPSQTQPSSLGGPPLRARKPVHETQRQLAALRQAAERPIWPAAVGEGP